MDSKKQSYVAVATVAPDEGWQPPPLSSFPKGLTAKRYSLFGLILSWLVGSIAFVLGIYFIRYGYQIGFSGWIQLSQLPWVSREILPLFFNIIVTILEYCLGYVHTTALRWTLGDKLTFNSHLRLFTYYGHFAFGFLSNSFNGAFLVMTYTATSLLFCTTPTGQTCEDLYLKNCDVEPTTYFCPAALLCIGIGLLGQSCLVTWQYCTTNIPSWESNAISTAWTLFATGARTPRQARSILSVQDIDVPSGPSLPKSKQGRSYSAHAETRRVVRYLWAVMVIFLLLFVGAYVAIQKCQNPLNYCRTGALSGSNWSLIPDAGGLTSILQIQLVRPWQSNFDPKSQSQITFLICLTIIVLMGCQAFLTMALHCSELLVNLSRDEHSWRSASTAKGYIDTNPVLSMLKSWRAVLLFASKPIVHWMFGMAIQFYYGAGLFIRPPQVLYLSILMILVATYGTLLSMHRPKGPQPATYGHLQTLINLIDVYDSHLYWGDKGEVEGYRFANEKVRHVGTWGKPLPEADMNSYYI